MTSEQLQHAFGLKTKVNSGIQRCSNTPTSGSINVCISDEPQRPMIRREQGLFNSDSSVHTAITIGKAIVCACRRHESALLVFVRREHNRAAVVDAFGQNP
jgi:hypothetical protein